MANKRFSRILQSAKYYSAIDNYIQYITTASRRGTRVGTGQARPASQKLYIDPFGVLLAAGQRVKVSAAVPTWNTVSGRSEVSSRVTATAPAAALQIKLAGFTPARIMVTSGRSNNGTTKTSAVTGMRYLSYGGRSTSFPFGRKDETDEIETAKNAIIAQLQAANSFTNAVYSFKPEVTS
jgi:hypothetical protein